MKSKFLYAWVVFAGILVGCGGGALSSNGHHTAGSSSGSGSTSTSTTSTTSGTTGASGVTVSAKKGGSVHDASGRALVVIPANALGADTKIFVDGATTVPSPPEGTQMLANTAYALTPEGLFFNTPASLTLAYDASSVPAGMPETAIQVYTAVGDTWQPLSGGVVTPSFHSVSVPIPHFSIYAAFCAQSLTSGPAYDVIDCGVLSGDDKSFGNGISSDGKVVGESISGAGASRAFLWQNGAMIDLGRRGTDIGARAMSVNNTGLAGGASIVNSTSAYPVKFTYGVVTQVQTQFGFTTGSVSALNDAGSYVVGNAVVRSGALSSLSGFTASTTSGALNANDEVAGSKGSNAAFWKSGNITDLGTPKDFDTAFATAISDDEAVVGYAYNGTDSGRTGFINRGGTFGTINGLTGATRTIPTGVNALGQVVGNSTQDGASRAFLYNNGNTTALDNLIPSNSGWQIIQASAINNRGQIVATGIKNGAQHAVILSPRPGR